MVNGDSAATGRRDGGEVGFCSVISIGFAKNVEFLPLCFCKCGVFAVVYRGFAGNRHRVLPPRRPTTETRSHEEVKDHEGFFEFVSWRSAPSCL
jgi:hypothetical protein